MFNKKGGNPGTQLLTPFSSYPLFPVSRLFLYLYPSDSSPLSCLCLHCFVKPSLRINPRLAALGATTAVTQAALVATLLFLETDVNFCSRPFFPLPLSVYLCPLHTSLFQPSI